MNRLVFVWNIGCREWRDFNYKPRIVRFACQHNSKEKDVIGGATLSQFSAASVPKVFCTLILREKNDFLKILCELFEIN